MVKSFLEQKLNYRILCDDQEQILHPLKVRRVVLVTFEVLTNGMRALPLTAQALD